MRTAEAGFQFTHPVWGATQVINIGYSHMTVSIHTPRAGCDSLDSKW